MNKIKLDAKKDFREGLCYTQYRSVWIIIQTCLNFHFQLKCAGSLTLTSEVRGYANLTNC